MAIKRKDLLGFDHNYAVIIGVDNYKPELGADLITPLKDAEALKSALIDSQGFEADQVFLSSNPTGEELGLLLHLLTHLKDDQAPPYEMEGEAETKYPELSAFLKKMKETKAAGQVNEEQKDSLLFYYAGHGLEGKIDHVLEDAEEASASAGFLVPADARLIENKPLLDYDSLTRMEAVFDALKGADYHHTLLILDCCYAGSFRFTSQTRGGIRGNNRPMSEERFERYKRNRAWQVLTSAGPSEKAADWFSERGEEEHTDNSPFANALINALSGHSQTDLKPRGQNLGDGVITIYELFLFLHEEVESLTRGNYKPQNPDVFPLGQKHDGGQFIFYDPRHNGNKPEFAPLSGKNPYLGLQAYQTSDQHYFFGRKIETQALLEKLFDIKNRETFPPKTRVLIVSGHSGSGKSSLVRAGLFPAIWEAEAARGVSGKDGYQLFTLRPSKKPWQLTQVFPKTRNIWKEIIAAAAQLPITERTTIRPLLPYLRQLQEDSPNLLSFEVFEDQRLSVETKRILKKILGGNPNESAFSKLDFLWPLHPAKKQILFIDQYEELYTQSSREERETLEADLIRLIESPGNLAVIAGLRSDFEWRLQPPYELEAEETTVFPNLESPLSSPDELEGEGPTVNFGQSFWKNDQDGQVVEFLYRVPAMNFDQLREALAGPALLFGFDFEDGLEDLILQDIANAPAALPLLSFSMQEFYKKEQKRYELEGNNARRFRENTYWNELGGVVGAVQKQADEVYDHSSPEEQDLLSKIMLRMIDLKNGTFVRRRVSYRESGVEAREKRLYELNYPKDADDRIVKAVIHKLATAQLIVQGNEKGLPYIEPAHDALINQWPRCLRWLEEFGEATLVLQRKLWANVLEYHNEGAREMIEQEGGSLLWEDDPNLVQLYELRESPANWMNEAETAFIEASWSRRQDEIETLRRQRDEARAGALAAKARQHYPKDQTLALNLAMAAYRTLATDEAAEALNELSSDPGNRYYRAAFIGHEHTILSVDFSPSEDEILTAGGDNSIRFWNLQGQELAAKKIQGSDTRQISKAIFSPDGRFVLSCAYANNFATLWDRNGQSKVTFNGIHNWAISSLAFAPSEMGNLVLTGGWDQKAVLWEWDEGNSAGRPICTFLHGEQINAVAFSGEDRLILTGGSDNKVKLWEWAQGNPNGILKGTFEGHSSFVNAVAFSPVDSPDGKKVILSGSRDNTAKLWLWEESNPSGTLQHTFEGHLDQIQSVIFSPDGQQILTASSDSSVRIWDRDDHSLTHVFRGHQEGVMSSVFASDGARILTGGVDQTAKLWDVKSPKIQMLQGHANRITGLSFSADGSLLLSGSVDETAKLWSATEDVPLFQLKQSIPLNEAVRSVVFPSKGDANVFATGSSDRSLPGKLWLRSQENADFILNNSFSHGANISSIAFSPVNRNLILSATASSENSIKLWEWNPLRGEVVLKCAFAGHTGFVTSVAFSPDGRFILSGSDDRTARLWEWREGEATGRLKCLFPVDEFVNAVAFSLDGRHILTGDSDHSIILWAWQDGRPEGEIKCVFPGSPSDIKQLLFFPDGKKILSADTDARLWEWQEGETEGKLLHTFSIGGQHTVSSIALSPDEKIIASGSNRGAGEGTVTLWRNLFWEWENGQIYQLNKEEKERFKIEEN